MAKFGAENICHQFLNTAATFGTKSPDCGTRTGTDREWRLLFPVGLWLVAAAKSSFLAPRRLLSFPGGPRMRVAFETGPQTTPSAPHRTTGGAACSWELWTNHRVQRPEAGRSTPQRPYRRAPAEETPRAQRARTVTPRTMASGLRNTTATFGTFLLCQTLPFQLSPFPNPPPVARAWHPMQDFASMNANTLLCSTAWIRHHHPTAAAPQPRGGRPMRGSSPPPNRREHGPSPVRLCRRTRKRTKIQQT